MQTACIDLTFSDDEDDAVIAQPAPRPAQAPAAHASGPSRAAGGSRAAARTSLQGSDDDDDDFDVGFMQNPNAKVSPPPAAGRNPAQGPAQPSLPSGQPPRVPAASPAVARRLPSAPSPHNPRQHTPSSHDRDNYQGHAMMDDDQGLDVEQSPGDQDDEGDGDWDADRGASRQRLGRQASAGLPPGGVDAGDVLKPGSDAFLDAIAAACATEAAAAEAEGCPAREISRRKKLVERNTKKELKDRWKEFEKQLKEQEKARIAELKAGKKAQKEADKAAGRQAKELQKALQGGPIDPSKFMTLRLSVRLMEAPWADTLITLLREHKFMYKIDASMPLSSQYAFARWARRTSPAVAAALLEAQRQDEGERKGSAMALQPLTGSGSDGGNGSQADDASEVQLLFPLIMLFMEPKALIDNLVVQGPYSTLDHLGRAAGSSQGAGGGLGLGVGAAGQRSLGVACLPDAQFIKLQAVRAAFTGAYPNSTLTVCCVGLAKELQAKERAEAWFNAQVVRDQLLDLQWAFPAIRLREDLLDGAQAAELMVTTTNCLGKHHKKQQDSYLSSFNQSRVRMRDVGMDSLKQGERSLAVALGHLMPAAKAMEISRTHPSLAALLDVLQDEDRPAAQRQAALMNTPGQRAATIGKQTAKNVFDFFNHRDGNAACQPST